jgi:hypothetical protein
MVKPVDPSTWRLERYRSSHLNVPRLALVGAPRGPLFHAAMDNNAQLLGRPRLRGAARDLDERNLN